MRPCARRRRSRAATLLSVVAHVAGAPDAGAAARGPSRRRRTTGCPDGKISVTLQSGATICSRDTTKPCPDGKISVTLRSGASICSRSRHHARIDPARSPGAHRAASSGGGALPDAGAARGGRGSAETNASSAASARHKAPRGSIVSIIYAGHACRRQHTLPNVWDNNRRNLIDPLARKYDPVRLFGWFEPDPPACDDTKTKYGTHATICACHAAIARLPWTDYTFSDGGNASEVRPRTNAPEAAAKNFAEALRKAKTGSAPWESVGPFRRYAAIATWVAADLDRHAFVVVTRPDLWFRQPIDAWDLDLSKDLNLPHRECPGLHRGGVFDSFRPTRDGVRASRRALGPAPRTRARTSQVLRPRRPRHGARVVLRDFDQVGPDHVGPSAWRPIPRTILVDAAAGRGPCGGAAPRAPDRPRGVDPRRGVAGALLRQHAVGQVAPVAGHRDPVLRLLARLPRLAPGSRRRRARPTEILAELLLGQEQGAARAQQLRVRRLRRVPLPRLAADRESELERRPLHAAA